MQKLKDNKFLLTLSELKPLIYANQIIDGTKGRIIIGNSNSEGDIKVIRQYNNDELYEVLAELEGWEYILNPFTSKKEIESLTKINSEFVGTNKLFHEFKITENIDILDTRSIFKNKKKLNKLIYLGKFPQFIINKYSTAKHLTTINKLNKKGYARPQ